MILKDRKRQLSAHRRQLSVKAFPSERKEWNERNFLMIAPALPAVSGARTQTPRLNQRSATSLAGTNGTFALEPCELEMAPHDVVFLQAAPDGKIHASRSQKDKEKNPDRICLDRRGLTQVPSFTGERNIRLLSLQHNLINRLDSMQSLGMQNMVFLDLYNNQVEKISGLEAFENLRVLLFGKNRLKKIEGLKLLTKLEVLDLHGNQISEILGLRTLSELKVLNLAGNQIRVVGEKDLEGLASLQELNLKRNRLRKISDLNGPSRLEKLFLSNNEISSMEDLSGISKAGFLREVTIDSNPVAVCNDCVHFFVSFLPKLQVLSHMQVTDQVRKSALLWRKNRESGNKTRGGANEGETSRDVISNARTNWEMLRKQAKSFPGFLTTSSLKDLRSVGDCDSSADKTIQSDSVLSVASSMTLSSRDSLAGKASRSFADKRFASEDVPVDSESDYFKLPPIIASSLTNDKNSAASESSDRVRSEAEQQKPEDASGFCFLAATSEVAGEHASESEAESEVAERDEDKRLKSAALIRKTGSKRERCHTAKVKSKAGPPPAPGKVREEGGDYLIEICGRCLNVYGQGALRFIDRPWNPAKAADVTTVRFNYVSYGGICNVLGKLKQRFPNAENFIFRETNIGCLGQLNALADVQGLSSLQIDKEGNPITEKNWTNYAIYRLAHWGLKTVNGRQITEQDLAEVAREYQGLSDLVLWSLPDSLLQPLLGRLRIDGGRSHPPPTARQWLCSAEPALRGVVVKEALQWRRGTQDDVCWRHRGRSHLGNVIDLTCSAVDKLQILEARWPSILHQFVRDTLVDYSHMDSYRKNCMQDLG